MGTNIEPRAVAAGGKHAAKKPIPLNLSAERVTNSDFLHSFAIEIKIAHAVVLSLSIAWFDLQRVLG
jgi:hypothetical protein